MAGRVNWTREQLLIVLNLYHKLRFGQMDARQKVIIELAGRIGRTPDAVAMKLVNLASLDPVLKLRGIRGLPGTSKRDRQIWEEYHTNAAEMIPVAQRMFDALFAVKECETTEIIPGNGIFTVKRPPKGSTEATGQTKRRIGQDYFEKWCSTITADVAG